MLTEPALGKMALWANLYFGISLIPPAMPHHTPEAWAVTSPILPTLLLVAPLNRGDAVLPLLLPAPMTQRQGLATWSPSCEET